MNVTDKLKKAGLEVTPVEDGVVHVVGPQVNVIMRDDDSDYAEHILGEDFANTPPPAPEAGPVAPVEHRIAALEQAVIDLGGTLPTTP